MIVKHKLTNKTFEFEPKDFIGKSSKLIAIIPGYKQGTYNLSECGAGMRGKDGQKGIICDINQNILVTSDKLFLRIKDFVENN